MVRTIQHGETTLIELRPSVAVVGAGLAGLAAAHILADRGYPVTVYEKGRGLGGRMSTRREGELAFDHGCQFFTARDERFRRFVEVWAGRGLASLWPARIVHGERGLLQPVQDESPRLVGVPGMSRVARELASGIDVRLGARVVDVLREGPGWRVVTDPPAVGGVHDLVLLAVPPVQAHPLMAAVPALQASAAIVHMHPCWAVMAAFDYDLELPFDGALVSGSPLAWVANNGTKPGRPEGEAWVLHASPAWSRDHLEDGPEAVAAALLRAFFAFCDAKPVAPLLLKAHRWRYASPVEPLPDGCLWDAARGMGACGDWCHSARAEGAFLSGSLLAERVLATHPEAAC